jgi:hypothetical protein
MSTTSAAEMQRALPFGWERFEQGERHGTLERTWIKREPGLTRFLTLAITPAPLGEARGQYSRHDKRDVEIWIGAQAKERFIRSLARAWRARDPSFCSVDVLDSVVANALVNAAIQADRFTLDDLSAEAPLPIGEQTARLRAFLRYPPH